jgi:hypothetical protein
MDPPFNLSIITQPVKQKHTNLFIVYLATDHSTAMGVAQVKPGLYALVGYPAESFLFFLHIQNVISRHE